VPPQNFFLWSNFYGVPSPSERRRERSDIYPQSGDRGRRIGVTLGVNFRAHLKKLRNWKLPLILHGHSILDLFWGIESILGVWAPLPEIWGQNPQFLAIFVENRHFWRPLADIRPPDHRQMVARVEPDNVYIGHFCARGYRLGAMGPQKVIVQWFWRNLAILAPSTELIYEPIATVPLPNDSRAEFSKRAWAVLW